MRRSLSTRTLEPRLVYHQLLLFWWLHGTRSRWGARRNTGYDSRYQEEDFRWQAQRGDVVSVDIYSKAPACSSPVFRYEKAVFYCLLCVFGGAFKSLVWRSKPLRRDSGLLTGMISENLTSSRWLTLINCQENNNLHCQTDSNTWEQDFIQVEETSNKYMSELYPAHKMTKTTSHDVK